MPWVAKALSAEPEVSMKKIPFASLLSGVLSALFIGQCSAQPKPHASPRATDRPAAVAVAKREPIVLRMVPEADLKVLDPIWTTAFITRSHGYMVYDTLFGVDSAGGVRPQMVNTHTVSQDGLVWTFTLRKDLAFHDDTPVTSDDVVASLQRWGQKDGLGQKMFAALDKVEAVNASTFRLIFKQPFGMVLEALSKPSAVPPFIMPRRIARTPADQAITDPTGSGPFIFKRDEFEPGKKVVYLKNTKYVPRSDWPSGTAGGKQVYVDRMEWVQIKDAKDQVAAISRGDVDMIQWVPSDQFPALALNEGIEMVNALPRGSFALHLNHHVPPFDNPKIARAALMAVDQEALLGAQIMHRHLYRTCVSLFACGSLTRHSTPAISPAGPRWNRRVRCSRRRATTVAPLC
jgi:peptide/nickel transport system substrate-binding protein